MHTYTRSTTRSFTRTGARHIASKIAADLRRLQSYYRKPKEAWIEMYQDELCVLLARGYLAEVEYGFRRDGKRVLCLRYTVRLDGTLADDHAGGVPSRVDITGAGWFSYLRWNDAWRRLSIEERERIAAALPIRRTAGAAPEDGDGYWDEERSYAHDGNGARRRVFRLHDRR